MMRDRLIEFIKESLNKHIGKSCLLAENIADDLIANGVVVPPCKIGDKVYVVKHYFSHKQEYEVRGFHLGEFPTLNGSKRNSYLICYHKISGALKHIFIKDIGKTVFLNREDAERALKGVTDKYVGGKKKGGK